MASTWMDASTQFPEMGVSPAQLLKDHTYVKWGKPHVETSSSTDIYAMEQGVQVDMLNDDEQTTDMDLLNDDCLELEMPSAMVCCSTPVRSKETINCSLTSDAQTMYEDINDCHEEDPDWCEPSATMSVSENDETLEYENVEQQMGLQRKFIVFEDCLDELLRRMICPDCKAPACDDYEKRVVASMFATKVMCLNGHEIVSWQSQPVLGRMPVGNLLNAAAVLFSGSTYAHIARFCAYVGLEFISQTTFYDLQREYLFPVVQKQWSTHQ
ncbi:uncharacterized protein LOC122797242 [Protopterus annectens]|uniref:uncharacterized protein LOC122797242 n=1 Tax=Protopterus annectens TaxID=7888 RepID=UPI001CFA7853|nr:uncharacterized protein LOC122797242 [Protopterus annectens]